MAEGPADILRREEASLLACVHCGFCLHACPTYTRLGHEGDSPRGRLDLMRAVAEGRLEPDDPAFATHIDRCLGCRACEPVCPSGVPYGFLLERARGVIAEAKGVSPSTRLLIALYTGPLAPAFTALSRAMRATPLPRLLRATVGRLIPQLRLALAMLEASAPWRGLSAAPARPQPRSADDRTTEPPANPDTASDPERRFADPHALMAAYPTATAATGNVRTRTEPEGPAVSILTGCVQESLFARVNRATERVLAVNGCRLRAAPDQVCCGALDAHAGRLERAKALARANIAAFEAAGAERVMVNAAGCGAMMKEYGEQLKDDPAWAERAHRFSAVVRDLSEFLAEHGVVEGADVALRITYDAPCHLHHGQRITQAPLDLLDTVPGLDRVPLPDADECCGGAGLYGMNHPELGGRITGDKIAAIRGTGAQAVVTPNPGCMMQIGAGLRLAGDDVGVLHPVEILDESYRRAAGKAEDGS